MHGRFTIEGDVTSALHELDTEPTAREIAEAAWDEIQHWVHTGYRPVLRVFVGNEEHEIDLGDEDD